MLYLHSLFARILSSAKKWLLFSWKFFTGIIVALVAFASNFWDLKQSEVTVEITAVVTKSVDPIDVMRIPQLVTLQEIFGRSFSPRRFTFENSGPSLSLYTIENIERQLEITKNEMQTKSAELTQKITNFNELASSRDNNKDKDEFLRQLKRFEPPTFFNESEDDNQKNSLETNAKIDASIKKSREDLTSQDQEMKKIGSKLIEAEKLWLNYKSEILSKKSRLLVTCAIGNRGSGATSLKPQALLRANLGDGNYLDLAMKLSGYENSSDLAALQSKSYKIVRFQSDELQSMNEADSTRYKTFLGNVSPATLFVSDVKGKVYSSNPVPFSPGVYEQKVYDSLKQFATKYP